MLAGGLPEIWMLNHFLRNIVVFSLDMDQTVEMEVTVQGLRIQVHL